MHKIKGFSNYIEACFVHQTGIQIQDSSSPSTQTDAIFSFFQRRRKSDVMTRSEGVTRLNF